MARDHLPDQDSTFKQLQELLNFLQEDDLELKKLYVRRYASAYKLAEKAFVQRLCEDGVLTHNVAEQWDTLADVDALIAATRRQRRYAIVNRYTAGSEGGSSTALPSPTGGSGSSAVQSTFRRPAAFLRNWGSSRGNVSVRTSGAKGQNRAAKSEPSIDDSAGPSKLLLSRIRSQKSLQHASSAGAPAASVGSHMDFRAVCERAAAADPTLRQVDLSGSNDFACLSSTHKAEAVRALAHAARNGSLNVVHLDSLRLDVGCTEALAELLKAPRLRTLTLMDNKLNETAIRSVAAALRSHPCLVELGLGDQNLIGMTTRSIKEVRPERA